MMRSHSDGVTPSAAMPNFMADRGARLVDAGYSILPIAPGAKCPGQYSNSNGWRGLTDWVRFCDRQPTALELEIWSGWPGCGIGIPGGRAVGIDIDVLNSDVALQIEALAQAELGATPAIRIGRNPKRLLVYRAKAVFQKFALHPIEVIAHGGQFVAHAIHPDTGEPYRWPVEDLSEIELASLPTVTEESCRRFLDAAIRLVPPELRQSQLGPDRHAEYYYAPGGNLHGTLPAVGAALSFIANDDLPYDDWIRIGMALKGGLGEAGWPLFQAWSGSSSKDKPETTAKAWRSLKPNRIGAGTIYGYALERGWLPDSDLILNGALAELVAKPGHPAASFLARIEAEIATEAATKAQEATPAKTPNDTVAIADEVAGNATDGLSSSGRTDVAALVATAPGLLGQITQWMISTAVSPQPFLSLGAALCVLGTAMGRRYRLNQPDTRSNLYVIALADSTSGKDHPRKCARRLLIEAGLGQHLGGETIASGSGLLASVAKHPVRLFQIDEFGHFVTAVLDPHSHAHHRREIMTQLTVLSTSATETVIGTEYANQEERPRIDICEPCVCVYASTVPHVFWGAMQHGNIADGSLPRFLIFQTERNFPDEQDPHSIDDGLHQLVPVLQSVAAGDGTLASSMAPCVRPILLTVPFNTEAAKLDQALRCRQLELKRQHEGTPFAAIVGRMREHTRRVALIAAVAVDHVQPVVTADVYRWAEALVEHCITTVIGQAKRFVADSAHEAMSKRVLEVIRRAGGWLDGNALTQRIRFLPRKARAEIIAELAEAGLVEVRQEGTLTKPRQLVRAAPE